jgi:hypothetical protein
MSEASLLAGAEFETAQRDFTDVYPDTLGLLAVQAVTEADRAFQLHLVRADLTDMPHDQAERFSELCDMAVPDDLRADKEADPYNPLWNQWLLRGTSDRQLMDFLQWNVEMIWQQQNDDRFGTMIEEQRTAFKESVKAGILGGWLHPDFEQAADGVDGLSVYVGDAFNTGSRGYGGFHTRGTNDIVIAGSKSFADGFSDLYGRIPAVAQHELRHPFGRLADRWADEAMTEHGAQVALHGQPHVLRPDYRRHKRGKAYVSERTLMADVTTPMTDPLPAHLASQAYSQIDGDDRLEELIYRFDKRWGVYAPLGQSAFAGLNNHINGLESEYRSKGLSKIAAGDLAAIRIKNMLDRDPRAVFGALDVAADEQL